MKLTLTKVFISDKDKNGQPLVGQNGRPYKKIAIKAREYGERWLSGFVSSWNENWREGQTVDAEVEQRGDYLNLKRPDPMQEVHDQLNRIERMLVEIHGATVRNVKPAVGTDDNPF